MAGVLGAACSSGNSTTSGRSSSGNVTYMDQCGTGGFNEWNGSSCVGSVGTSVGTTSRSGNSTSQVYLDQCGTGGFNEWNGSSCVGGSVSMSQVDGSVLDSSIPDAPHDVSVGDSTTDAMGDADACPPGQFLVYTAPGCGSAAHPVCAWPGDACYVEVCNCDGTPGARCDQSSKPYAHDGPCVNPDAGADAATDGAADAD
jgi:hypothetical protein